jgi:CPA2 family monovalent cation:H+ antiporter-2
MTAAINLNAYSDALVVLGTAGIVVPILRRWRLNPVLGYLGAGALLGPLGLGSLKDALPFLYWITIVDAQNVAGIAELGVVFLLFLIGLELSYRRLLTMRRLVFGLGSLQVVLSTAAIGGLVALAGHKPAAAIIVGASLALSSTAIVLEVLAGQQRLSSAAGRASFSVLLAQDLAVVPLLLFVSIVGMGASGSVLAGLLLALGNAALALGAIVILGRLLLKPLFRLVASAGSNELFVATTLFVIVGSGVAAGLAGLSMALGAFVAGLLLAETEYEKAIQTTIEPFKGLLLGIFFFTVGMTIDVRELLRDPIFLTACVVGVIGIKSLLLIGITRLFRKPWHAAIETGLLLGPGGEFAFVAIGMATALGVVDSTLSSFTLAVTSLSMTLIPPLAMVASRLSKLTEDRKQVDPELAAVPLGRKGHAIVIGHGRVGQVVCDMLEAHHFHFIAVDNSPEAVSEFRRCGRTVYYGNAEKPSFLESCGLANAAAAIVTIHTRESIDEIVEIVRSRRPDIAIVARARDADHARHLYAIGVTDAVPETIEASLQLSEAALVSVGLPAGPVIASIHQKRDEFRHVLQDAATQAGAPMTRSIRPKRSTRA